MSEVESIRVGPKSLDGIRELAAESAAPLLWLLNERASPSEDTLSALLEHSPGPAASLPVDERGDPILALLGRVTETDAEGILAAVERRRLPLRHIQPTSLLVERDLVIDLEPPDPHRFGWYAGVEWTARLFARQRGFLVPTSRVRAPGSPAGSAIHVLRVARASGWRKGETLRELHRTVISRLR